MARGTFGERLKRERELREVTLEEITSATRIGPRFLEALENEEWEKLPGGVFNRGFVRSIARYLGLDEEVLLGEYDLAHGAQVASTNPPEPKQKMESPSRWRSVVGILITLLLLAAIVVGAIFAWKHFAVHRGAKAPPAASAPAAPLPASPDSSAPIPPPALLQPASSVAPSSSALPSPQKSQASGSSSGPLELLVSASAATHLLVLADDRVAFYDEIQPGKSLHFLADQGFEVTAADSGAVLLELNGQAMPPLGLPGSSGTIKLSRNDLRQTSGGDTKP
ncbi:MAG TPA: helix-turn-helix domain-containing protein [Verrucomicrobiae bacterium]|nr:helix-turn-helix domain-containing protein [Verrucomicrobiae bacterium]